MVWGSGMGQWYGAMGQMWAGPHQSPCPFSIVVVPQQPHDYCVDQWSGINVPQGGVGPL
jgi:hypothetical protein